MIWFPVAISDILCVKSSLSSLFCIVLHAPSQLEQHPVFSYSSSYHCKYVLACYPSIQSSPSQGSFILSWFVLYIQFWIVERVTADERQYAAFAVLVWVATLSVIFSYSLSSPANSMVLGFCFQHVLIRTDLHHFSPSLSFLCYVYFTYYYDDGDYFCFQVKRSGQKIGLGEVDQNDS